MGWWWVPTFVLEVLPFLGVAEEGDVHKKLLPHFCLRTPCDLWPVEVLKSVSVSWLL